MQNGEKIEGIPHEEEDGGGLPDRDHDPQQQGEMIGEASRFPFQNGDAVPDKEDRDKEKRDQHDEQTDHQEPVRLFDSQRDERRDQKQQRKQQKEAVAHPIGTTQRKKEKGKKHKRK